MSDCPSCGRYLGLNTACPYCGASLSPRMALRWLRIGALLLALGGLSFLWLAARQSQVPVYSISELTPTMNLAYIGLDGVVSRAPRLDAESGALEFWLDDGTGEVYVAAFRQEAAEMLAAGRVPHLADRVMVEGTLRWREDFLSLTVNLADGVLIERPAVELVEMGAVSAEWEGRPVRVMGVVRAVRQPYEGLTLIELRDASGSLELAVEQEVVDLSGELPPGFLEPGRSVQVDGVVSVYRGSPQLTLADAHTAQVLPVAVEYARLRAIGSLADEPLGSYVRLSGAVAAVEPFSAGVKVVLDDGSGQVTVLLWQSVADGLEESVPLEPRQRMDVAGELASYRGELEVIPETAADLTIAAAPAVAATRTPTLDVATAAATLPVTATTPAATATPTTTPWPVTAIGDIRAVHVGQTRLVQAEVKEAQSFSAGLKFLLDDGSGQLVMLLWSDQYAALAEPAGLRPGAQLRVSGVVGYYQGELQLEAAGADVLILRAGDGPPVETRPSGTLDQYEGATLAVEGPIVSMESFGDGNLRLMLDDGSGPVAVILWQNVLAYLDPNMLETGRVLRVIGQVGSYDADIQLVPALPVYVTPLQ